MRAVILILVVVAVSAAIVIAANLAGGYDAPCDWRTRRNSARSAYGAVSSTHYAATRIGPRAAEGGNDAAMPLQFALTGAARSPTGFAPL